MSIGQRIYQNFLMGSRLDEYRGLLVTVLQSGYEFHPMLSFKRKMESGKAGRPTCILRHDIDSDVRTARQMYDIERRLGITSTFFFRLSTVDIPFMRTLESEGSEAGYHFEELSDHIKRFALSDRTEIIGRMHAVRREFESNLLRLRQRTGLPLNIIASHGDFINRKLHLINYDFLDSELRARAGIELEAYDRSFACLLDARIADDSFPKKWNPESPEDVLQSRPGVFHILVHPRQWKAAVLINLREDITRLYQGFAYTIRSELRKRREKNEL